MNGDSDNHPGQEYASPLSMLALSVVYSEDSPSLARSRLESVWYFSTPRAQCGLIGSSRDKRVANTAEQKVICSAERVAQPNSFEFGIR